MNQKGIAKTVKNTKEKYNQIVSEAQIPAGVKDVMKVYERFQEAFAVTEKYLDLISPKTHQSNSNQSFLAEIK
jgi:hypothetical protein